MLRHPVGDFVPSETPLIDVHGGAPDDGAETELRGMVALGVERTIEQDPAFAIRIMVDIAIRALSPAVNDPTTAVQVLNHLEDLVRLIGRTPEPPAGRVVVPARGWEEYLSLAVTEIRQYGASSVQVTRRLRALLEELREVVPPDRRVAVEGELARLDATVNERWGDSTDLDIAGSADRQGIGGPAARPDPS